MSGFGSQAYGSSPYGLGTPEAAPDLGGKMLADTYTGQQRGSRKIDPYTKDYVLDDYGRISGMSNTHQLVLLAVSTTKGSSAMRSLGQELPLIERITANFARRVDVGLRDAVKHIVDRSLIEVVDTKVEIVRPGVARARLRWRDLETGEVEDTLVGEAQSAPAPAAGRPLQDYSLRTEDNEVLLTEDGDELRTET